MRIEKIYFNTEDNAELFGLLHTSENQTDKEVVIAIHGMGSNCFKQRDDIIAQKLTSNNISYFSFNNRGFGLVNKITKNGSGILQGTAFEDVKDSYYDIVSAIKLMASKGYEKIHLQGHSLGSTKSVYVYNKLLQNNETKILNKISSVILLSLVDLTSVMQFLVKNSDEDVIKIAKEKEAEKELNSQETENIAEEQLQEETTDQEAPLTKEEELEKELEKANETIEDQKDKYLRLSAEFDNYRKRTVKEKAELILNGGEKSLSSILPVVDDLERALQTMEKATDVAAVKEGVELIYNKFISVLGQNGVKVIETKDKPLDTDYHEAIAVVPAPSEKQKGKILDCVQTGYTLNGKVIRHAKVVVGE